MMRRAIARAYGPATSVLSIESYQPPPLGSAQVRVRMVAAAINPSDLVTIAGAYPSRTPLPFVPGFESAGRVEAVAEDVSWPAIGDWGLPLGDAGLWQEVKIVEARWCFPVGNDACPLQAATSYINPLSALLILEERVRLARGLTMALNAAGSALGRIMIRMANARGVRPIAIIRNSRSQRLLAGLDLAGIVTTDRHSVRRTLHRATGGRGVDVALDAVGGQRGEELAHWIHSADREAMARLLDRAAQLVRSGIARTEVEEVYPLRGLHHALRHATSPGRKGKVMLSFTDPPLPA